MVRIYTFNAFASSECSDKVRPYERPETLRAAPNRFSVNRSYDRSVIIDGEHDDMKGFSVINHNEETEIRSQTPVVVLSRGKGREKEHEPTGSSICSEHGITFRNVKEFIDGGVLELVKEQSFLIYSQETGAGGGHRQVGVCAALAVEDCLKGSIKRHEKVTKDPTVTQRRPTNSSNPRNVDPVMMMYRQNDIVQAIIDKITVRDIPIILHARSRHGSRLGISEDEDGSPVLLPDDHKIWSIRDQEDIEALKVAFLDVESLYIADGHHRTAAACRTELLNKSKAGLRSPSHTNFLLGFLYPHTHMRVLPYNRCVSTLGEKSPEEFLRLVSSVFRIIDRNSGNYINADSCSDESIQSDEIESVGVAVDLSTRPLTNPPVCSLLSVRSLSTSSLGVQHFSSSRVSSPEKSIVRGLVVSMDSESESDSESDSNSEIEDQEGLDNISTFYNSSGFSYSILERSLPNRDSEKSQRSVAVSLLEQDLEGANCSDMYIRARDVEVLEHSGKESCLCAPGERPIVDRLIGHHLPHIISMYFEGRWLDLSPIEAVEDNAMDPLASLNIQVLFERLLKPLLGIDCPRTDPRLIYVCGSEGLVGLESRVNSKAASLAFYVGRVTVTDIMRVADAGQLMPPKATCFSPKPLSGLLVRLH